MLFVLTVELPIRAASVKRFSFTQLEKATNGFSETSLVGQGGYGNVYKGILDDGTVVAIKRAKQGSLQGEREFLTEIEFLSRLHHRNLVSLVGYCDEEHEQVLYALPFRKKVCITLALHKQYYFIKNNFNTPHNMSRVKSDTVNGIK